MDQITDRAQRFFQVKKKQESLERELDAVKTERAALERELVQGMQDMGLQQIRLDSGDLIFRKSRVFSSVRAEDIESLAPKLEALGLGGAIQKKVLLARINEYIRLCVDDSHPEAIPEEITWSINEQMGFRRKSGGADPADWMDTGE